MNIILIDEHVQAFSVWTESLSRKKDNVLLHVDSHGDMEFPSQFEESLFCIKDFREFEEKNLTIASFIVPAAILGCFSKVYYLKPINEPNPYKPKTVESEDKQKKKKRQKNIFKYSFYSWQDEGKIWYRDLTGWGSKLAGSTKTHTLIYHPIYALTKVPQGAEVILDIDMDYFSCNHFVDYQYKPRLTERQIKEARQFSTSSDAYKANLGLVSIDKNGRFIAASADHNSRKYEKIYNDDFLWIDFAIREFVAGIRKRVTPSFISIARSVKTGYTPAKNAACIESSLLANLKSKNQIDVAPPYKATFSVQNDIFYNPAERRITNTSNLDTFTFDTKADIAMWQMIQAGARFGDIIECLMKDFNFTCQKAEKELIANIWYLKKDMVLR